MGKGGAQGPGQAEALARVLDRRPSLPKVVHLVEHVDVVADLLVAQEAVHVRHKDQELLEALAEGHQHGQAVGAPGRIFFPVLRRRLRGAGAGWAWGLLPLSPGRPGHVTGAAELQPEQGDEAQEETGDEQVEDGALPGEAAGEQPGPGTRAGTGSGGRVVPGALCQAPPLASPQVGHTGPVCPKRLEISAEAT